jgi:hypothetical protein
MFNGVPIFNPDYGYEPELVLARFEDSGKILSSLNI